MASTGIQILIRLAIEPKNRKAFDEITTTLVAAIRANEPNTLAYGFYVAADDTSAVIHERYPDSAAFIAHMTRTKAELGPLLGVSKVESVYVLGEPTADARAILDGFGAKYLAGAAGFSR